MTCAPALLPKLRVKGINITLIDYHDFLKLCHNCCQCGSITDDLQCRRARLKLLKNYLVFLNQLEMLETCPMCRIDSIAIYLV